MLDMADTAMMLGAAGGLVPGGSAFRRFWRVSDATDLTYERHDMARHDSHGFCRHAANCLLITPSLTNLSRFALYSSI